MFSYDVFKEARCTEEEKKVCIPYIRLLVSLSKRARKEGLLSLDGIQTLIKDPFLRMGLQLILDGTDHDYIESLGKTHIYSLSLSGISLLKKMIILEGIMCLKSGVNPILLEQILVSYLGESSGIYKDYLDDHDSSKPDAVPAGEILQESDMDENGSDSDNTEFSLGSFTDFCAGLDNWDESDSSESDLLRLEKRWKHLIDPVNNADMTK